MKTAAAAAANTSSTTANNAKGKNAPTAATAAVTVATNNVRLSRRDQEQAPPPPPGKQAKKHLAAAASSQVTSPVATAQLNYNTMTRRRMTSMEPNKVRIHVIFLMQNTRSSVNAYKKSLVKYCMYDIHLEMNKKNDSRVYAVFQTL